MVKVFFFLPKKNLARKPKGCKPIDVDYYTSQGDLNQAHVGTKLVKCLTTLTTIGWANPLGCFFLESCEEPKDASPHC
jgi:hypothetical protein